MTRRHMEKFRITELSAVDRPAQEHARMTIMKRVGAETETDSLKKADNQNRGEVHMSSFTSFDDLTAHYKKSGMAGTLAMKAARDVRPDLFAKMQERQHQPTADEQVIAKARAGASRRNHIAQLVEATVLAKRLSRIDALRLVRQSRPDLFEA